MNSRRNAIPRNARAEEARQRALATVARMRRDGTRLRTAASLENTDPATVMRYAGSALTQRTKGSPYRARPYDRLIRRMALLTSSGEETVVTVRDSRTASTIAEYSNALRRFLNGDESALAPFRGRSFRTGGVKYEFATDPAVLTAIGKADALPGESLYRSIYGGAL